MLKKLCTVVILIITINVGSVKAAVFSDISLYAWAAEAIERLADARIMLGTGSQSFSPERPITRAEYIVTMMRIIGENNTSASDNFPDVPSDSYYYEAVGKAKAMGLVNGRDDGNFAPGEPVSRQDMFVMAGRTLEKTSRTLSAVTTAISFVDERDISDYAKPYISKLANYISGNDEGKINPREIATRAETAVFVDRLRPQFTDSPAPAPTAAPTVAPTIAPIESGTAILGKSAATLEQAKAWAANNGASQKYIDAAEIYWKYGDLTGIRPDVLYAQAAKETRYGNFGGRVTIEMNNWAGIKTADATGDEPGDHESFPTSDDGIRAHFNHVGAYIGIAPIGTPHARYHVVAAISWAGSIRFVEEFGGRWAPEISYGTSIVSGYLNDMVNFSVPQPPAPIDKSKKVVYLSPSNQYLNLYSWGMTNEGEQMIMLGDILKNELTSMGFNVVVANPSSTFEERAAEAVSCGAFCYVALHTNAANKSVTGTEIYYRQDSDESYNLASFLYGKVAPFTPSNDRGLKNGTAAKLLEIRLPNTPNCLIEIDFHDVAPMAQWLVEHKTEIAHLLAEGIAEYWSN
ncbi:MAG: S-layer homology domain-containing protein [Clostridiales bacterium]|jgi:hypothetical protein|nr:S-layer homology domain-containing protein [Clostridiales bacterium]